MKGLTNRSSQSASGGPPGAFDFIKLFSKFAALAAASRGLMMFSFRENTLRASRPCRTVSRGLHSLSGRPSGFSVRRIVGKGNLWITEYVIIYEGKRV
jgi:hypothetical protein